MAMATDDKRRVSRILAFFKELHDTVKPCFDWYVTPFGAIRGINTRVHDDALDPICAMALAANQGVFHDPHEAAEKLGLEDISLELMEALENRIPKEREGDSAQTQREIRRMGLDALGLKGER